jgi:phosphoserine phosphatase
VTLPRELLDAIRSLEPGGIAAFDADGTLWRDDIGEAFLRHLAHIKWVKLPGGGDPYEEYERRVEQDRRSGYAFAAQLQAGLETDAVLEEAEKFARIWVPPRLVAAVQELRDACEQHALRSVVVSASPLPIVLAAAPLAGVSPDRCLGIEVRVSQGRHTDRVIEPVPYDDGKVAALQTRGWNSLALACGDSLGGDLALLSAARVAVAVAPQSGSPLAEQARKRGWTLLPQGGP